jgi:hypothetical protein
MTDMRKQHFDISDAPDIVIRCSYRQCARTRQNEQNLREKMHTEWWIRRFTVMGTNLAVTWMLNKFIPFSVNAVFKVYWNPYYNLTTNVEVMQLPNSWVQEAQERGHLQPLVRTLYWTFRSHEKQRISWLAEQLLPSQEGLCSMQPAS